MAQKLPTGSDTSFRPSRSSSSKEYVAQKLPARSDTSFRPGPISSSELLVEESEPETRKLNRAPTVKYDMHTLREVNAVEEAVLDELMALYQVEDEDDLPVDFDIFKVIEKDAIMRRQFLVDILADCPSSKGALEFIEKFLDRVKGLNPDI